MLVLKQLFTFYINASIHVALAVVSLYLVNVHFLNILSNTNFIGFLFFGTIVCYNFVKYGVEAEKYVIVTQPSHKPIQVFSFFSFLGALYFLFHLSLQLWVVIVLLTLLSALYGIPFLPGSKNLRSLGGLKVFLVALVWVGFTLVCPVVEHQLSPSVHLFLLGMQTFILVLVLLLPFEMRDLKYDSPLLKTLPQQWGIVSTKKFGYLLIITYFVLGLIIIQGALLRSVFYGLVSLILFLFLWQTKKEHSAYFSSFWVESIPIMMLLGYTLLFEVLA